MKVCAPSQQPLMHQTAVTESEDLLLAQRISQGDQDAFCALIGRYQPSLLRVARTYVDSHAVAEEVVQDTWMSFVDSLTRFQHRCSVKTWLFAILVRCAARTRDRERRSLPFSAVWDPAAESDESAVDPQRFFPPDHHHSGARRVDRPEAMPTGWADVPEDRLLSQELRQIVDHTVAGLPPTQRQVFTLRDIEGLTTEEVGTVLQVTANHQRVLLHRARARVRRELERYLRVA